MTKNTKITFFLIMLYVLLHAVYVAQPYVQGGHQWRQADVASVARNFATVSMNIFLPRVNEGGAVSGIAGMEFPLFNYGVALVYKLTGSTWSGIGKILSFIFAFGSIWLLFIIINVERCLQKRAEANFNLWLLSIGFLPFLFLVSSKFMPEFFACFLALLALYSFLKSHYQFQYKWLVLGILSLEFATLARPYYGYFGVPVIFLALKFLKEAHYKKFIILLTLGLSFFLPLILWYGVWVPYLDQQYKMGHYFYMGSSIIKNLKLYFTTPVVVKDLLRVICQEYLNWLYLPLFLYGLYTAKKSHSIVYRWLFWIGLVLVTTLPMVIGVHFLVHYYFLGGILPMIMTFVYLGFENFIAKDSKKGTLLVVLLAIISLGTMVHTFKFSKDMASLENQRPDLLKTIEPSALIISPYSPNPVYLYVLNHHGWALTLPKDQKQQCAKLQALQHQGAQYILQKKPLSNGQADFSLPSLKKWMAAHCN